jgi:hypothetical protein
LDDLLRQIEAAVAGNAYYLALYAALTLPDICGAMESSDGIATKARYIAWFDARVADRYRVCGRPSLTGDTCYYYRCSLLHQGRSQHPALGYSRILFLEPGASNSVFHNNILNDALNIDVRTFCRDIIAGVRTWQPTASATPEYKTNYPLFMQRYPNGIAPYIVGTPVIG